MHLKLSKVLSYKRHLLFMLKKVGTSFIFIPYGLHKQMFKEKKMKNSHKHHITSA